MPPEATTVAGQSYKVAHPVVFCPHCRKQTLLVRSRDPVQQCRQCGNNYANTFIEAKPGELDDDTKDLPVKVVGAEVPKWAVHTALVLAAVAFLLILAMIAVRVAHRPTYESAIGVMSDIRTVFMVGGRTETFSRNLTFFVPASPSSDFDDRWTEFVEALRQDGAAGYTRWKVEGSDGTRVREGYFVLLAVPVAAESTLTRDSVTKRFQKVFGANESLFVIDQSTR